MSAMSQAREKEASVLGVMGGSGLYELEQLENASWVKVDSPFGKPSDDLLIGTLAGQRVVMLPRHGRGHSISPSEINYRANIDVLKRAGVTDLISVSACGSLRADLAPGTFVIVDQFIDRTFQRAKTFFEDGLVAHVAMGDPVCWRLGDLIEEVLCEAGIEAVRGGTYLAMEGPQFSTRAESELYRSWQCDVIGMTNMPEAKLAREAEICYASVAMVTDYDCWHADHGNVDVAKIIEVLQQNASKGKELVTKLASVFACSTHPCVVGCDRVLDAALITAPHARDAKQVAKLSAVAGRVLGNPRKEG